jgi:nicotinamidase-related amidase
MLEKHRSQLLIIDVQKKLYPVTAKPDQVIGRCTVLLEAARELGIPAVISEQYPKGLGATAKALSSVAGDAAIMEKIAFSCLRDEGIYARLEIGSDEGRDQIVIGGMEAHVCVLQTALDLKREDYEVFVAADAVTSRKASSRKLALARMRDAGITIINTEMAVFEWLERAGTPEFKALSKLIK